MCEGVIITKLNIRLSEISLKISFALGIKNLEKNLKTDFLD